MEEFTFPSIPLEQCNAKKLSFPHFASPSPWFVVPGGAIDAAAYDHRRSFSAVEQAGKANNVGYHGGSERFAVQEEDNKMDMLWEDFNEELAHAAPPCPLSKEWTREAWLAGDGGDGDGDKARRHAVASGSVVRRRRLSLMMMLKLLKKLFLAHKSSATARKALPI